MFFVQTDNAIETLRRLDVALSKPQIAQVESRAINKTLLKSRTVARREVKNVYNISQKNLGGIDIKRSSPVTVLGMLVASRKPIPLDAFAPKQEMGSGSRRITKKGALKVINYKRAKKDHTAGVSIEVFKGKPEVIPFAFMIPGGAIRVFARGAYKTGTQYGFVQRFKRENSNGNDTPIKPLITVSQFGFILNDKVLGNIAADAKKQYPVEFERQVVYMLSTI